MDPTFIPTAERRKQVKLASGPTCRSPSSSTRAASPRRQGPGLPAVLPVQPAGVLRLPACSTASTRWSRSASGSRSEFKPQRLEHQDLEGFARQLVTAGLVQHEQPGAGKHLFEQRAKQRRIKRLATVTNILYIKIPVFDPDRILTWMYQYLSWIFTHVVLRGCQRRADALGRLFHVAAALQHVLREAPGVPGVLHRGTRCCTCGSRWGS